MDGWTQYFFFFFYPCWDLPIHPNQLILSLHQLIDTFLIVRTGLFSWNLMKIVLWRLYIAVLALVFLPFYGPEYGLVCPLLILTCWHYPSPFSCDLIITYRPLWRTDLVKGRLAHGLFHWEEVKIWMCDRLVFCHVTWCMPSLWHPGNKG